MAMRIELPKEMTEAMLEQAQSLRIRQIKAATNNIIKEALQKELDLIAKAINTMQTVK